MARIPSAWVVFAFSLLIFAAIGFVAALRSRTPGLRRVLLVAASSIGLPGLGVLAFSISALSRGAVLAPFTPRSLLPAAIVLSCVALFLGTWIVGSPAWWAIKLNREAAVLKRGGLALLAAGGLGMLTVIGVIVVR